MHSPKDAPDSSLSYMMGRVNAEFSRPKGGFYVKRDSISHEKLSRDLSAAKNPVLLLATAFSLKAFLDFLRQGKMVLKLPAGSRLMETGGFKGRAGEVSRAELYRLCKERLGLRHFVSEYGMTELSSQFYCVYPSKIFQAPAWMRTIAVDPDTGREAAKGRSGVLRHVDLANVGSVAAVQTEDLGRLKDGGFEFLGRAKGAELRGCSLTYEEFIRS
jgi:acyl-CoA synthetase (AMP-forming)/AMP-acid ligase II